MAVKSQSGIRVRLTRWFFLAALLPLLTASVIIYIQGRDEIKSAAISKLSGIRDLKVNDLRQWLGERKGDIRILSKGGDVRSLEFLKSSRKRTPAEVVSLTHVRTSIKNAFEFYNSYSEIFMLDSSGKVVISTDERSEGLDKSSHPYFREALQTRKTHVEDIHFSEEIKDLTMSFSHPVFCNLHSGEHLLGVIVLRIDLVRSLYPILLDRAALGRTGETLVVNRDAVVLNDLRWYKDAPLKLKIGAQPAVKAAAGETGVIESRDYRLEPVLAAFTNIPETGWGFVAKQDQAEVYRRVNILLRNLLIIFACSMVVSYALSVVLAGKISKPVLVVAEAARSLRKGDLDVHISEEMEDEFKVLADAFNGMVTSLSAEKRMEADIIEINAILVTETDIKHLAGNLLEKLIDTTFSAFGTFHMIDKETGDFELLFSSGLDPEKLKSVDPQIIKGALNTACEFRKTIYLDRIPKDTVFTVNTVAGTAIPRSILTIPVIFKGVPRAVISLGSLNTYPGETRELLKRVRSTMNSGISNIISSDEIQRLASILDLNNAELESQTSELRTTADELQMQNRELALQRREVEEASNLKSEFLSNMSHELRTPLNSVLALSSVLKMQSSGKLDSEEMGYLDIIERNGRQLLDLINDILDLSKIEAGRMEIAAETFNPKVTIESILETIEPLCREKSLELEVDIPDNTPRIKSDERKLFHIVQNLLSNAVKFTEEGKITVSVRSDGKNFSMVVSDTGIGIEEENLDRIFREFKQIDGSTARRYEGTGLGLAIARKAARLLGGDLLVTSEYGKGSVFTLDLPLIPDVTDSGSRMENYADRIESPVPADDSPYPSGPSVFACEKILIVEDNESSVIQIKSILAREGYQVSVARSGVEAVTFVAHTVPDAIIMDLMMPGMDGFELLDNMRSTEATRLIPVLVLTAKDLTAADLGRLKENNIFQLVQKGDIRREDLIGRVRSMLLTDRMLRDPAKGHVLPEKERAVKKITVKVKPGEKPCILVIEDNPDNMKTVKAVLKDGYKILEAFDGETGLDMASDSPSLILLDISLPGMDGFHVIRRLKDNKKTVEIPVIALTAHAMRNDMEKILDAGFDDIISKPIVPEKMLEKMSDIFIV